jgi:IS30 family transposase
VNRTVSEYRINVYYVHSYVTGGQGLNENMNGLIQQYLPKAEELKKVNSAEIDEGVVKLNYRSIRLLHDRKSHEVFPDTTKKHTVVFNK